jgi:hypothetical protein
MAGAVHEGGLRAVSAFERQRSWINIKGEQDPTEALPPEELLPPGLAGGRSGVVGWLRWRRLHDNQRFARLYEAEYPPCHELNVVITPQIIADLLELRFLEVQGINLSAQLVFVLRQTMRFKEVAARGKEKVSSHQ